jgi:hypothetical protein|tara:strand:- start:9586 stop:10053 length:468 start_codon:yes stop_codon:yes gene_type:complete
MATLSVTIKETVTLNGKERGSENVLDITSVNQVYHRIVTCPANVDTTVATFRSGTNVADGALDVEDVKYIRVTNLDSSNDLNLSLQIDAGEDDSAADESATILLQAGKSFIMGTPSDGIAVDDSAATIVTALHNLESILLDPGTNAISAEIFIAS